MGKERELGLLTQPWWSVAGSSERDDLCLTNLQYFLFHAPPWNEAAQWRIGMTPNITCNWTDRSFLLLTSKVPRPSTLEPVSKPPGWVPPTHFHFMVMGATLRIHALLKTLVWDMTMNPRRLSE